MEFSTLNGFTVKDKKAIRFYDNVESMKNDETLKEGMHVKTSGYYLVNDGGHGEYKIREKGENEIADNGSTHELNNELIAELISKNNSINVKQFGAKGDGETDDTLFIQNAILYCKTNNLKLIADKKDIFLITQSLDISNMYIDLNMGTITTNEEIDILSIDSTTYFTTLKNINIDCNNIATNGIDIVEARKALFENINIDKIENVGINYHEGYELIFNNINLYGNTTSDHNIGLLCDGGDSYFNNIIMIDLLTAIVNKTSFNYFTNVHAWIYHNSNILDSKFLVIDTGNRVVLENCYCDTYRYCIYQKSSIPVLLINNFVCVYNRGLLTPEILGNEHPYFMYCETNYGNSKTRLSNSNIDGYSSEINTYLTNESAFSGEIISSLIKNCDHNVSYIAISDSNNTSGVEITSSNIEKVGKVVCVDGQFKMDTTSTKSFIIGTIPYYFRPSHQIISCCSYGTRYNFTGMCYLYIGTDGKISVTFPNDVTGQQTVKVNETFITNIEE